MARDKGVVLRLVRLREAGDTVALAQGVKALPAARDDLVGIALMAHIENEPVLRRVVDPVDRDGELHRAEIGREMPTGFGDALDLEAPQLLTECMNLGPA